MEKRKIRKKLRSLLSLIMSAVLLAGMIPESVLAGGITTQTVLQAVQEADSGCNVAPPEITSFQSSEEKNTSGNWTFSGTFTAVAGAEVYELHLGTMEGNGSVYERGLYTLNKTATSFSVSPNWYDYTAVAGDTVYAALEAIIKTGSGNNEKMVSTGWQSLKETTVGPAPEEGKKKLTVRFINQNQMSIATPHIEFLDKDEAYSVDVPEIEGYDCQYAYDKVSGTMGDSDVTVNVPYQGKEVGLHISYVYNADGSQAADPIDATYRVGDSYSYDSPEIATYSPDIEVVEGYILAGDYPDKNVQVRYSKGEFILETRYVLWDGDNNAENDEEIRERDTKYVEAGTTYSVTHTRMDTYMRADDQGHVILDIPENENVKKEGVMPAARHVVKLYYLIEKSNLTINFVREDDNSQVAVGFTGEWRRDQDFTWEAPIDGLKGYQLVENEEFFDGKNITIPKEEFRDKTGGYGNAVNYTKTFKYYKKVKDTVHYRYGEVGNNSEVFEDDTYFRYAGAKENRTELPRKDGYISSRTHIDNKDYDDGELNKDKEHTVYYSSYSYENGREISQGEPVKIIFNDRYRDPITPNADFDLEISPVWQWGLDRDAKSDFRRYAAMYEPAELYINGKKVATADDANDACETGNYTNPRGTKFVVNTSLIPSSGNFTLTTYEKRYNGRTKETVWVKTDFDANASGILASGIGESGMLSIGNVTENIGTDTATWTWTMPADSHLTYTNVYNVYGRLGNVDKKGAAASITINEDGSANFTVTLDDSNAMEPESCTVDFYGRADYQENEGEPAENRWIHFTKTVSLGGVFGEEDYLYESQGGLDDEPTQIKTRTVKFSTKEQSAFSAEVTGTTFGMPRIDVKWNYQGGHIRRPAYERNPDDWNKLIRVDDDVSEIGYITPESKAAVVDLATNKVIGSAGISTKDGFWHAVFDLSEDAMLEHYLVTGNTTLNYAVYLQTAGVVVYTDSSQTELGSEMGVEGYENALKSHNPLRNFAYTASIKTDEVGYESVEYSPESGCVVITGCNEWTVVKSSYSFAHDEVSGEIWADTSTPAEDRRTDYNTGWSSIDEGCLARIFINSKANWEGDLYYDIFTNEYGKARRDTLAGQGVNGISYQDGHGNSYRVTKEDANTISFTSYLYDGSGSTGAFGNINNRYYKPGDTVNVLVDLRGYYTVGDTVHIMTGSITGDVPVAGTIASTVTDFKVTKDKVELVKEENKDPRIALEMEWTHKLNVSTAEEAAGEEAQASDAVTEDSMMAISVGEKPLADNDMRIEVYPLNAMGTGNTNLLYDNTDNISSFVKTETGCKLTVSALHYSDVSSGYRLPDGYRVIISYLKNGSTIKTFYHEINLMDKKTTIDKNGGTVLFQIDDEGNALVRANCENKLRTGLTKVSIYDNNGNIVKNGVLNSAYSYSYNDEIKGAWLEKDSWYDKTAAQWFKLDMTNVSKESRAKYYAVLSGYDQDRNYWDKEKKHYATAENFITIDRCSVNDGVFRAAYTVDLHENNVNESDAYYNAKESYFTIGSQDGKKAYAIRKDFDPFVNVHDVNGRVREYSHTEKPIDNKDSTKLIYFGEENATDLMGDEFTATFGFGNNRYMSTVAYHEIKSEKVTITEQPFLQLKSATMDMSGYTTITGNYDTDVITLRYRTLKFNIICPDGYVWTNSISYNDENFTYSDVTGAFSYKGKLADVVRGAKIMEHYNVKDFVKLKGKEIKCSVTAYASGGDIESAQIKCVFGGKLKPQVTMIETSTYNGESVLKASLPAGYMEYGVDMGEVAEQAKEAGQGLLIVTDDNYSIAFSKDVTATLDTSDAEFSIKDVTNDNQANVVKSGLTPAGAYEATISGGFTGSMEMGLPTGKLANGAKAEVYYVDNDGNKTAMNAKTVTGTNGASRSKFTTTHNSTYVVVHEGGAEPEEPEEPETPVVDPASKEYAINVMTGAVAKNSAGTEVKTARVNEVISISWTAKTGFEFVKWDISGATPANASAASTTFVMGTSDVTVGFEEKLTVADEVKEELPSDADTTTKIKSLKFEKTKLTIQRSSAAVANPAKAEVSQGEVPEIIYVTENKDIVAVDKSGNFWPMGVGETTVTAYCGNKNTKCKVTVVSYTESIVLRDSTGAEVSDKTLEMKGGEIEFISVSFAPYDSTDPRDIKWESDNKKVTIKNGMITAKEVTEKVTATISATVKVTDPATGKTDKELVSRVKVNVTPVEVAKAEAPDKGHGLTLSKKALKLTTNEGGNTADLGITLSAKKDTDINTVKILSVESSNPDVVTTDAAAEISVNGKKGTSGVKLTAKSAGTAYIVVKSIAGDSDKVNVKRCKITVSSPAKSIAVKSGSIDVADKKAVMRKGEKGTVEVVLNPELSTDLAKVKISGSGGITVKKGVIYAKKVTKDGKPAKITVKCGKLKETIEVTVTK